MIKRCVAGALSRFGPAVPLLAVALAGCVTTYSDQHTGSAGVGGAIQQPFRDVSLMRENPPEVLLRAAAEPYRLAPISGCLEIRSEVASLDSVLGPDIDTPSVDGKASGNDAISLVTDTIGGILSLPFRWVIRRVSGAEQRERDLANAILAGMVRRGYLKGVLRSMDCPSGPPP